ncbi:MAG: rRNA methyltransferase [Caldilineaceae bacterium]|nr:rRNA methyltransferase [Caldilineaceae bacterium]
MNLLDSVAVVLHRPEDPTNLGAVVRAMKNMGFADLRLVEPVPYTREELLRVAHHAEDIIERICDFPDLDSALADATYVVGTAAVAHPGRAFSSDVRGLAIDLLARAHRGRVALLFGPEADGLDRTALDRCHIIAMLPTVPDYPALNLAQSVLLVLYELRMTMLATSEPTAPASTEPIQQDDLERFFQLSEEALAAIDFFRYEPAVVMRTLRQLAYRAELRQEELGLLMAIARAVWRVGQNRSSDS